MNEASVVVTYKLDLLIQLIDTTTGEGVTDRDVRFYENGKLINAFSRGSGNYVFLNCGRADRDIDIRVYGYDDCQALIRYDELDERMPIKEVYLMPSEDVARGDPVITFSGRLSSIESVQAVNLNSAGCSINSFDERKKVMTLFKKYQSYMEDIHYGLINQADGTYEYFKVIDNNSYEAVKLAEPLSRPFVINSPIGRVIFGRTGEDGSFTVKVRDSSDVLVYILRYVVGGEERFKTVDFHHLDGVVLE